MDDAADHGVAAVIMVLSTCEAEAILKKSGLSVVDLFRPFGDVEDINGNGHAHPHPRPTPRGTCPCYSYGTNGG